MFVFKDVDNLRQATQVVGTRARPMLSSSPESVHDHDAPPKRPLTKVPAWIPVSAFIGTSLALAVPLLLMRRQRSVLRVALRGNTAPPPRRSSGSAAPLRNSSSSASASASTESTMAASSESDSALPGIGETMSALSRMNLSTAMMAGKAFAIATGLVAVGGATLTFGVKSALGVEDAREFGQRMRHFMWSSAPSLSSRIHRAPETDDERHELHAVAPFGVHEEWSWEDAEKRMNRAYEEGGVSLWAQTALRELEAEARVERDRREREMNLPDREHL